MRIETLWLPKSGHADDEYEDAFAASDPETFPFRAAIADGATESAFSGGWARTLAGEYLKSGALMEAAASARRLFSPVLDGRWYVEAKATEGAHAALLGLELGAHPVVPRRAPDVQARRPAGVGADRGGWRAESVGDCCLFHVRGGELRRSWPFADAGEFHHRPELISSRADDVEAEIIEGAWQAGDTFVLATDALAAWLLEAGVEPLLTADDFDALVEVARRSTLRNDDTTAVIIRL